MSEIEHVYLPLKPNKRRRFGLMIQAATPAFLLILTAVSATSETVGGMLLRVLTAATGVVIIYGSVKDYKSPGSGKWMGLGYIYDVFRYVTDRSGCLDVQT
jgi:hypothetical protein